MVEEKWARMGALVCESKSCARVLSRRNSRRNLKSSKSGSSKAVNIWKPKPVLPASMQSIQDKDAILNKFRSWLPQIIKDSSGYNLSSLSRDFELAMGMCLDHQKLGFASLQELMKDLSEVVYVEPTKTGLVLRRLVKQDGNIMGLNDDAVTSIQSVLDDRADKGVFN